ncbi:hypothetical protein [Actinopolyspora halophila]|nr:hypothetical protein [Actinopolyspora halophila]
MQHLIGNCYVLLAVTALLSLWWNLRGTGRSPWSRGESISPEAR